MSLPAFRRSAAACCWAVSGCWQPLGAGAPGRLAWPERHTLRLDNGVLLRQEEGALFLAPMLPWQLPRAVEQEPCSKAWPCTYGRGGAAAPTLVNWWGQNRWLTAQRDPAAELPGPDPALARLHAGGHTVCQRLGLGPWPWATSYIDLADALAMPCNAWSRWPIGQASVACSRRARYLQLRFQG